MKKKQTCNICVFFKPLGSSPKKVYYLFKNNVSSVSPACEHFKVNTSIGFKNKNHEKQDS